MFVKILTSGVLSGFLTFWVAGGIPSVASAGTNQAFDPLNPSGTNDVTWGSSTLTALTESATSLSDRDDYQMMTSNVLYTVAGGGLAYVPGTYHIFGNNGSTRNVGSGDTALNNDPTTNVTRITATQLYRYLTATSDHLPIVADYTIPAPTVFIIVIRNDNWASIRGNTAAPYINNDLPSAAAHAELYFTVTQVMTQ